MVTGLALGAVKNHNSMENKMKTDIRQEVTERIVALLESGNLGQWIRPWSSGFGSPLNLSGRRYSGMINILLLQARCLELQLKYPVFGTYKQIQDLKGSVNKGAESVRVVFWKNLNSQHATGTDIENIDSEETRDPNKNRNRFCLKYFNLFAIEQTTLDVEAVAAKLGLTTHKHVPIERIEKFIEAQGMKIVHGGDSAFYNVKFDYIQLPHREHYISPEMYYFTSIHEHLHASGHHSRLGRNLSGEFNEAYMREELLVELGTIHIMCSEFGLEGTMLHAAQYMKHYIDLLKSNSNEIFQIASKSKQAVDYLLAKANLLEKDDAVAS